MKSCATANRCFAAGGADIVLSTTNSVPAMSDSVNGLRPDGRLVIMGAGGEPLALSTITLLSKRMRVIGSSAEWARISL
jgi:alcohol dehydrogenase